MKTVRNSEERPLVSFDWALKRLLRNKVNYEVVEGFLSELLGRQITVTNIPESSGNKEHPTDKHNKVDVIVEDKSGEIILIELQFTLEIDYFQRMLYGSSKTLSERMVQGDKYMEVKKVYSINIVYFDLGQGADYVYHGRTHFRGLHTHDELQLSKAQQDLFGKVEAVDLFPEYYILKINNFKDVAKDTLDEWVYFLKHDRIKEGSTAQGLAKANEVLAYYNLSSEERKDFDYEQDIKSCSISEVASVWDEARVEAQELAKANEEQAKVNEEQARTIGKQTRTIEEQAKTLEEQTRTIDEQAKEIAEFKRLLNRK
jgi:predicted transposase/invertase (TIGR01784 family)